jgi:hypothetical protein
MKGNLDDWAGLVPVWTSFFRPSAWQDQPGTHIARGFACRDDTNLYFRYDFSDGSPRAELTKDIKELDYVQVIYTKDSDEVTAITKFTSSSSGTAQKTVLGIRNYYKKSWKGLADNRVSFRVSESMMEIAVPLDLVKPYISGDPEQTGIFIVNAYDPKDTIVNNNRPQERAIDFGF